MVFIDECGSTNFLVVADFEERDTAEAIIKVNNSYIWLKDNSNTKIDSVC